MQGQFFREWCFPRSASRAPPAHGWHPAVARALTAGDNAEARRTAFERAAERGGGRYAAEA